MKNIRKVFAIVLALALCLCMTAGCSSGSEDITAQLDSLAEQASALQDSLADYAEQVDAEKEAVAAAAEEETATVTLYSSDEDYTVYHVNMTMQAGYQEYQAYDSGMMTIHAGIGYIDPLGEGYYYAGIGYDEIAGNEEAIYVSDWMDANFGCSLFCIYSLPDGDIYTWDGIYGANAKDMANYMSGDDAYTSDEVDGSTPTRTDALINIVVGGTGAYAGATGVLIGSTSGGGIYGTTDGMTLPQTLFKLMEGYIKVPTSSESTSTHTVTQDLSEDTSELEVTSTNYAMVDVELRLQSGSLETENNGAGSGVGTFLPFNANALTTDSGNDIEAAANYPVETYFNDNWLDAYGDPTFIVFHVDDGTVSGDIYGWQFSYATILDTSSSQSETGTQSALFTLIVDGTGDFENVTGILSGHSATCNLEGWGLDGVEYDNDDPLCNLTLMEGCLKVPASSAVVTSGLYANDTITD